jgi:hypothetical protein
MVELKKHSDLKKSSIKILKEKWRGDRNDLDTKKLNACDFLIGEAQFKLENCAKIYFQLEVQKSRLQDELKDLEELKTSIDELLDEGYESNLWDAVVESVIQQKDYRKMIKGV